MAPQYAFYCPHCGGYDRRNWSTGGCRWFDDKPAALRSGIDPPCALEEAEADAARHRLRKRRLWIVAVTTALGLVLLLPWTARAQAPDPESVARVYFADFPDGRGSAIYLGNDRWLTAWHVADITVASLRTPTVSFFSVETEWSCEDCDLAVLRTPPQSAKPIEAVPYVCRLPDIGEEVSYTGSPSNAFGLSYLTFFGRVAGHIDGGFVVHTWSDHGASGSGVVDAGGTLVGVVAEQVFRRVNFRASVPLPLVAVKSLGPFCDYERSRVRQ